MNRRSFFTGGLSMLALSRMAHALADSQFFHGEVPRGPFLPFWESLKSYRCPDWFQDAKFGIWAHWSPQCVPEQGDWYARNMYIQGTRQYEYHVKQYGHPSQVRIQGHLPSMEGGAMGPRCARSSSTSAPVLNIWSPWLLITTTSIVGIRNISPGTASTSVPKRDIVGTWEKFARSNGLRFGVSYHGTPHRVWDEFLPVRYKSDTTGPLAGVPYDGVQTIADGKGKWWEGMDPQAINGKPHPKGSPCPEFVQQFHASRSGCHR